MVRDPLGNIVTTFAHPADSLTILSRAGQSLNVNITDSLTTANFTVGNIDNAFADTRPDWIQIGGVLTSGTVSLSANQFINEWGSDGATDIVSGALLMRAGTGIGTGGNFIETQVSAMEAESTTGGIALSNINDVTLEVAGSAGELLRGLWTGTSGNVTLINQGSILLSDDDGVESVRSAGNLSLTAIGAAANISSDVNRDALLAIGNITLSAGRDVLFGTVGADYDNDVRAGGSITIAAGRDFHIDGFSDMAADDQGLASNGGVNITAGRDILIEDDNGVDASVGITAVASTASVVLTTGIGGTLSLAANSPAAIQGRNGGVLVNADRILVENDSGINASGTGAIRLTGSSAGRLISIGSATDGVVALELSDAELNRMFANTVIVGSAASGQATVVGAINHANTNLAIESGEAVLVQADITTPGSLTLRSAGDVTVSPASSITTGAFNAFVDTPDDDGPGGANFFAGAFSVAAGTVQGGPDSDTLKGVEGLDFHIHGLDGADVIISSGEGHYFGDGGNDTITAGLSSGLVPEVLDGGAGVDTLDTTTFVGGYIINLATGVTNYSYESFVNFENVITAGASDEITGSAAANTIQSGGGNDKLDGAGGVDTLIGGQGDDWYFVDNAGDVVTEAGGEGNDRVFASASYTLTTGAEVELITTNNAAGTGAINLGGNEFVNSIVGNAGNNTLDGKGGADTMNGQAGDDFYYVDNAGDAVVEIAGWGNDRVLASVSYTLGAGVQVETLTTTNSAGFDAINLTGNELVNWVAGNAGNNTLDGKGGADTMNGLAGDDWYFVDNAGDVVIEAAGMGTDRVFASTHYTLGAGVQVETLTTTNAAGTSAINLTGNEFVNSLVGNAGNNTLDGKGGADTMNGQAGDDFYYVDNAADVVIELAGWGTDRVFASTHYTLGAGVQVETLTTTDSAGLGAINLSGNELVNWIAGNAGNNTLDGKGGADTLNGLAGDDFYFVDSGADVVIEGAGMGTDRVFASTHYTLGAGVHVETLSTTDNGGVSAINLTGNEFANAIVGNAGSNILDGKGGADTLNGAGGADTFRFTAALGGGNVDAIQGYAVADDVIQIDNAVFTGLADGALAAGAFHIGAAAADADDRIIYNAATGALLFDADGSGAGAAVLFATLDPGLAMAASEFLVI